MNRFRKHYSREQARSLLPQVREWLERLNQLRRESARAERHLETLRAPGIDLGGKAVDDWVRSTVDIGEILAEFHRREIQLKDLDRGLVDFPAYLGGREVFLCWEQGEDDIGFWHDLDSGYAGREPLQ
jgi:hypothetical protein